MNDALKPLLIAGLETGLNSYLSLDDHIPQLLTPMLGKVIAVHITTFDTRLYLSPSTSGIQILEDYAQPVDATISGSLAALGLMSLSATPMHSLFKGEVTMAGDMQLARQLQRLFAKIDINLDGKMARYLGDDLARRLGETIRGGRRWGQDAAHSFRLNLEEFLQEETRDLPARAEAEILFQDIDTLRSDHDRLAARIERIDAHLTQTASTHD